MDLDFSLINKLKTVILNAYDEAIKLDKNIKK